jgi:hypothetical protein
VCLILLQHQVAAQALQAEIMLAAMVRLVEVVVQVQTYQEVEQEFLGKVIMVVRAQIISAEQVAAGAVVLGLSEALQHSQVMLLVMEVLDSPLASLVLRSLVQVAVEVVHIPEALLDQVVPAVVAQEVLPQQERQEQ